MKKILAILGIGGAMILGQVVATPCLERDKTLDEKIRTCEVASRADFKATEIAKLNHVGTYTRGGLQVGIISVNKIEGGVEVFARAWRDSKPVGFGVDGSIEIERFKIYNPPILVPDPNGKVTITREFDGVATDYHYREDMLEAVRQVVIQNIEIVGKDGSNIVKGRIGHTVSTFYPDASVESTSVDGFSVYNTGGAGGSSWATAHGATDGTSTSDSSTSLEVESREYDDTAGRFEIERAFTLFDTSAIPDTDPINSATISLYVTVKINTDNDGTDYINVYTTTPASNTAIVNADYDAIGTTAQATAIDIGSISTSAYTDWTLNATGEGNISLTGITKFGFREGHDAENVAIATDGRNIIGTSSADQTGTTQDPKLVVDHGVAVAEATPVQDIIWYNED